MNWTQLLRSEVDSAYRATEGLIDLADGSALDWKPATGQNWMTMGQLLKHVTNACGEPVRGFVTEDWGMPEGMDPSQMTEEDMLPPAAKMPAVKSVAEAKRLLAEDKQLALKMLAECTEEDLANRRCSAPWDPPELPLGQRILQMVEHLNSHKDQLFYYLKLQGKPVNTMHLWGMQ